MSGKVVVKFLRPIHEREVTGEKFNLFQGSVQGSFQGSAGLNKVENNNNNNNNNDNENRNIHTINFQGNNSSNKGIGGGGMEEIGGGNGSFGVEFRGEMGRDWGVLGGVERGYNRCKQSSAVLRDRMSRLVRYRMLQVRERERGEREGGER